MLPRGYFPPRSVPVRSYQGAGIGLGEDVAQEDPQVRRPRLQLGQVLEEGVALQDPGEKAPVRQGRNRILRIIATPQLSAAFSPSPCSSSPTPMGPPAPPGTSPSPVRVR